MSPAAPGEDVPDRIHRIEHLLDLGRSEQAGSELTGLLEQHPGDLMLRTLLARAQLDAAKPEVALATARAVIAEAPETEYPFRIAALAAARLHRVDDAVAYATEAVRLDPGLWRAHLALASVTADHVERRSLSWTAAARAVELAPAEPAPHFLVGVAAQRMGDVRTAQRAYRRTLELQPGHALALNNLGVLQARRGRGTRAAGYYLDAAASDPQEPVGRLNFDRLVTTFLRRSLLVNAIVLGWVTGGGFAGPVVQGWAAALTLTIWVVVTLITLLRLSRRSRQALTGYRYRHRRLCRGGAAVLVVQVLTIGFGTQGNAIGVITGVVVIVSGLVLYFVSAPD